MANVASFGEGVGGIDGSINIWPNWYNGQDAYSDLSYKQLWSLEDLGAINPQDNIGVSYTDPAGETKFSVLPRDSYGPAESMPFTTIAGSGISNYSTGNNVSMPSASYDSNANQPWSGPGTPEFQASMAAELAKNYPSVSEASLPEVQVAPPGGSVDAGTGQVRDEYGALVGQMQVPTQASAQRHLRVVDFGGYREETKRKGRKASCKSERQGHSRVGTVSSRLDGRLVRVPKQYKLSRV